MKVSDFKFIDGYGYPKIDRLVMNYDDSKELFVMLKAAKKYALHDKVLLRIYHRFSKLRSIEEKKDLLKGIYDVRL